jgi:hypothetical protein
MAQPRAASPEGLEPGLRKWGRLCPRINNFHEPRRKFMERKLPAVHSQLVVN